MIRLNGDLLDCPFEVHPHPEFRGRARPGVVIDTIVLHQSVTSTLAGCERTLRRSGYGVHLVIDPEGRIHQYGDLVLQYAHANERNRRSIGVEVINPYVPTLKPRPPWFEVARGRTAWRGAELVDAPCQRAALASLLAWLTAVPRGPLAIPLEWPTTPLEAPAGGQQAWHVPAVCGVLAHGHRGPKLDGTPVKGAHADARRTAWLVRRLMEGGHA